MLQHITIIAYVAAGGAVGAVGRYAVMGAAGRWLGAGFPWGTIVVNVVGSLLMGMLIEIMARYLPVSQEMRAFAAVGVLGAFTTFSTFSLDVVVLIERSSYMLAFAYILGSVILSVAALFLGLIIMRQVL